MAGVSGTIIFAAWSTHTNKMVAYKSYREIVIMSMNILVGTRERSLTKNYIPQLTTVNIHYNHKHNDNGTESGNQLDQSD